jgi:hypothetical protein
MSMIARVRSIASAVVVACFLSLLATSAHAQDECSSALPIVDGTNGPYNIATATASPQPWHCGGLPLDLWFVYTASCCGNLTVDNCAPVFSMMTAIELSDGTAGCGNLVMLDCQGSSCGYHATVTVPVVAGQVIYVRVGCDQYSYASGIFDLHVSCVAASPSNDECINATPIVQGQNGPYRSFCATTSALPWTCANVGADVWFSYQATASGPFTFRTCNSTFDTAMEVYDASAGCGNLVSLACNDNFCGYQSSATASLVQGQNYLVRVGGINGEQGLVRLEAWPGDGTRTIVAGTPGCGSTTIALGGNPYRGSSIFIQLGNTFGLSFIGLGFGPFPTQTVCGCQVGHGWHSVILGSTLNFNIPNVPYLIGVQVGAQGADLGGTGGCTSPNFTLTRTHQIVIG